MKRQKQVNMKIYPNLSKRNKESMKCPLYLKLTYDGQKVETRLPKHLDLTKSELVLWDDVLMRIKGKIAKNIDLNHLESNWEKCQRNIGYNKPDDLHQILFQILEKTAENKQVSTFDYIEKYMANQLELKNDITEGTKRNYRKAVTHFKRYLIQRNIAKTVITGFKYEHARDFNIYLGSPEVNNQPVSASSNIRRIKTIFGEAIREDILLKNPFDEVKIIQKSKNKTPYLTLDQIKQIIDCKAILNNQNLHFYKDLFLFSCFTGLSCIDYRNLQTTALFPVFQNRWKLNTSRTKSSKPVIQIIPSPAQVILEKYKTAGNPKVFPKVSMETINEKLKQIGAHAGLNIPLTTKIARTTCNNLIINTGQWDPIYQRAFLGWSNNSDIQNVYTSIEDEVLLSNTERFEKHLFSKLGEDLIQKIVL